MRFSPPRIETLPRSIIRFGWPMPPTLASLSLPGLTLAVFAFFDALTPGDTSPASRWPAGSNEIVYPSSLAAAVIAVPGVLSCVVVQPAAPFAPSPKRVCNLSDLLVHA